jgi:GNAT superfamily N-acetyltransferase
MSVPRYRLRDGLESDAEAISMLVSALALRYIGLTFEERGRAKLLASMSPRAVLTYLKGGYHFTLAEHLGRLVGVVAVRPPSHLFYLFVEEAHHRRGMARVLWDYARAVHPAYSWTVNASAYARPIYERLGFRARGPAVEHEGVISLPMRWIAPPMA